MDVYKSTTNINHFNQDSDFIRCPSGLGLPCAQSVSTMKGQFPELTSDHCA